jgi:hypothetical protein
MHKLLHELLNKLEGDLNPEKQAMIESHYKKTLNWEPVDRLPLIISFPYPASKTVQPFPHGEIFDNPEKMLFNELVHAFSTSIFLNSEINDDLPYTIRANFGTVIIPSLFGAHIEQRDDNPPWVRHFETQDEFLTIFDRDPTDFSQGICPQIIERYQYYRDVIAAYPNLQRCIRIVLPDLQGPLDSLELLRGSTVYEDFIMEPERVEKGLRLMAQAQVRFAEYLNQFTNDGPDNQAHQHATTINGNILIRIDSAIMISPEMYAKQVAHHDEFVLKEMDGGGIHSCGRIDFNIPEIFRVPSIRCFDFGQSYLNDLDPVYKLAMGKKIPLIRIRADRDELLSGRILKRFPTGVSLIYEATTFEDAKEVSKTLKL